MKAEIEQAPCSISSIARHYRLLSNTLQRAYRDRLSDYHSHFRRHSSSYENECFVFPENFGTDMAIDETGLLGGELYTIIYNKAGRGGKGSLAAIIKGTKGAVINDAIQAKVPFSKLVNIREVTTDMSHVMYWVGRQMAPNAVHTYDRFHVGQLVHEAVQHLRIKKRWEAIDEENEKRLRARKHKRTYKPPVYENGDTKKQLLARSRHLLYKPSYRWTETQRERAAILFHQYPDLHRAYKLAMEFNECYRIKDRLAALQQMKDWVKKVKRGTIKEMVSAAESIEDKLQPIVNYFTNRATNAAIENFNAKLKLFKRLVRGINDKHFFFYRLIQYFA